MDQPYRSIGQMSRYEYPWCYKSPKDDNPVYHLVRRDQLLFLEAVTHFWVHDPLFLWSKQLLFQF